MTSVRSLGVAQYDAGCREEGRTLRSLPICGNDLRGAHLSHGSPGEVAFSFEIDEKGDGKCFDESQTGGGLGA